MTAQLELGGQRWRAGRSSFRPAEPIRTAAYDVASIPDDRTARAFIVDHHYSGSYPAARERIGLYRGGELAGVAVFSQPTNARTLSAVFPLEAPRATVELGRLVLLDDVPGNGETWFLGRCFELLRAAGYRGVVSFSDPIARTSSDGRRVFPGHIGTIYQAHNARYLGRGTARTLRLLPDATVFSPRAAQKVRAGERGWEAAVRQLIGHGAQPIDADADPAGRAAWLRAQLAAVTRPLPHPGNHKYAWALNRRVRAPASRPYPKLADLM